MDAILDELGAEASAQTRDLLKRAYERGFREALATSGRAVDSSAGGAAVPAIAVAPTDGSVPPEPQAPKPRPLDWDAEDEVDDEDDDDESEPAEEKPEPRPILASATIATLRRRIVRTFDLERFEVDLIICARGDRDRRQLKGSVRLSRYLAER